MADIVDRLREWVADWYGEGEPPRDGAVLREAVTEIERLRKALNASSGYLQNAAIDLETGAPKRTAINTINGGLRVVRDALGLPQI